MKNQIFMKTTTLFIIVLLTMFLSAQIVKAQLPIDPETGKVKFTAVVDLPSTTKDKIYNKAKLWVTSNLKSGDNIVDLNTPDQVVATGTMLLDSLHTTCNKCFATHAYLNFKFIVLCKDNKMKYSVENFILFYVFTGVTPVETGIEDIKGVIAEFPKQKNWDILYLKRQIDGLIAGFNTSMKKEDNNNW
jgi:hypothetical protein